MTDNEGISGNQVVDPSTGNVYIAHTTTNGLERRGRRPGLRGQDHARARPPRPPGRRARTSTPRCARTPPASTAGGNPEELAGENFASIARDSAGYLYVDLHRRARSITPRAPIRTSAPSPRPSRSTSSTRSQPAGSRPVEAHLVSAPSGSPAAAPAPAPTPSPGSPPAATAASTSPSTTRARSARRAPAPAARAPARSTAPASLHQGRVDRADGSEPASQQRHAPSYTTADVSEAPVKHGQICTNGIGCATGGDRSLGDFLQVSTDSAGRRRSSPTCSTPRPTPSAGEDAGPEVISRQLSGPSLFASAGTVTQNGGPGLAMGSVTDPTGDADLLLQRHAGLTARPTST